MVRTKKNCYLGSFTGNRKKIRHPQIKQMPYFKNSVVAYHAPKVFCNSRP